MNCGTTSARRAILAIATALIFFALSCRSAGGGAAIAPLPAGSPDVVWRELQSRAGSFEGARSYLRLRLSDSGRVRAFNARFFASRDGRVLLDAVTPVGTTAFTLYLDGTSAMWIDEIHATYWEGEVRDVAPLARFVGGELDSRAFAMIILGLPFSDASPVGGAEFQSGRAGYTVGETGLASVTINGGASRIEFLPASFPPVKLSFSTSARPDTSLQVEHLDLTAGPQRVGRPAIPRGYTPAQPVL